MKNKELLENNEENPKKQKKAKIIKPSDKRNKSLKLISVSSAILFIAIVIIFNIVFESLFGTMLKWDWSQTDLFSVGDVTTEIVGNLDEDITIVGLYEKGTYSDFSDIEILLDEYVKLGKGRITVQYIDPVQTPSILKELDPDNLLGLEAQTFVVHCAANEKSRALTYYDLFATEYNQSYQLEVTGVTAEQAFSGAIVYAEAKETPVIYMTKGQGEADYESDYTTMLKVLQDNNYLVKTLDLLTATEIPEDAELLVMLDPKKDITQGSKDMMDIYLKNGNSLLVLTNYSNTSFPVLNQLLEDYNIEITDNRIREGDKERRYQNDAYYFFVDAPSSSITSEALASSTLVSNVRSIVELKNASDALVIEPILETGDQALVELDGIPETTEPAATSTVALACTNSGYIDMVNVVDPAKVMVYGSTEFVGDPILSALGTNVYNIYAFYSSVNWLMNAEDDDLLITAKELPTYTLTTASNTSYWIATVVCIIIIPIGLLILALVVYRKRKNL